MTSEYKQTVDLGFDNDDFLESYRNADEVSDDLNPLAQHTENNDIQHSQNFFEKETQAFRAETNEKSTTCDQAVRMRLVPDAPLFSETRQKFSITMDPISFNFMIPKKIEQPQEEEKEELDEEEEKEQTFSEQEPPASMISVASCGSIDKAKTDVTIKKVVRDLRQYFVSLFDADGFSAGKDHWKKERWLLKVT